MFEYVIILLLYTMFFVYLNFISYAWLNKVYPITKNMLYYLVTSIIIILLLHLFWPGMEELFSQQKVVVLVSFSGTIFFFHFFGRRAISRVDDWEKINTPSPGFYNYGRKFFTIFFLRLMPLAVMITQLSMIWTAGNL